MNGTVIRLLVDLMVRACAILRQIYVAILTPMLVLVTAGSAQAQAGQDPPRTTYETPLGVSTLDLGYSYRNTDLTIGSLSLERSYASQRFTSSETFGYGWTHNWDMWIRSAIIHTQWHTDVFLGRSIHKFDGTLSSNYPDNDETGTSVTVVNGYPTFTDRDGTIYTFGTITSSFAKITNITRPNGEVINFSYASGLLKYIASNRGYALVFDYSGSVISAACGFNLAQTYVSISTTCTSATLKTAYSYTGSDLTSFSDVNNNTATLKYDYAAWPHYLTCVTNPGSAVCPVTNTYGTHPPNIQIVAQQTLADGTVWHYDCTCGDWARSDPDEVNPIDQTTITDGAGQISYLTFTANRLTSTQDENGKTRQWQFFGRFFVQSTEPEGNLNVVSYNPRMVPSASTLQAKPGTGLSNIVSGAITFASTCTNPITCNEPLTVADANGNVSSYTYDSTHGGVLTETSPANGAGISAVVRHAYAQKYAYIKNSGGTYSAASTPIWLRTEDRSCNTTATVSGACAGGSTDEVVTSYDYGPASGPNNLMLRGKAVTAWDPVTSSVLTLRTCYTYDWMGNKISETSPRANLSSCS